MAYYRTNDGQALIGRKPDELVAELRRLNDSRSPVMIETGTDAAFMKLTASRVLRQMGLLIRSTRAEDFIADLVKAGLLLED